MDNQLNMSSRITIAKSFCLVKDSTSKHMGACVDDSTRDFEGMQSAAEMHLQEDLHEMQVCKGRLVMFSSLQLQV